MVSPLNRVLILLSTFSHLRPSSKECVLLVLLSTCHLNVYLARRDVVRDLLARLERQLRLLLLEQLEAVDDEAEVRLELVVARPRREHLGSVKLEEN